ncbi:ribbon-helix-helix domain-containing protein [Antribacter sp. KLBMP9083]|uniref:Ribbon-helix-helix domain-containing protein n=1 Tax=Antribacter soli TaxID=2910976 RepID=A0AA41QAZ2_9MICO|nr:ribbon-helix-helix domain-containing protein [Antribacter soli]MCF4119420.1 ribbon-helix-helix domain-containing protein [Antribacter soli]
MTTSVKLGVSLPKTDVEFLDDYAARSGLSSRSAALHEAVRSLRDAYLEAAYLEADEEWYASGEAGAWDAVVADGLDAD